mmetsp:Transcript_31665/g.100574  ORF Transcript_31665/g.100574 Transcript_31665/m.100574 type:complete len:493 (-) Transcript_31665:370-1848(-)
MAAHVEHSHGRQVAQSYFDELVEENMRDFEVSREEAIKDTIEELKAQGVDVCNLDTTGDAGAAAERAEVAAAVAAIKSPDDVGDLSRLVALLGGAGGEAARAAHNREAFFAAGGVVKLFDAIAGAGCADADVGAGADALSLMMKWHAPSRNAMRRERAAALVNKAGGDESDEQLCISCLALLRHSCLKSESNKNCVFNASGGQVALFLLEHRPTPRLVKESALLLRAICMADDYSVKVSGAHDRTRDLNKLGAVGLLVQTCKDFREERANDASVVLPALFACVKQFCTNVDSVKATVDAGMLDEIFDALRSRGADASLCRSGLGALRNIAADDDVKHRLMSVEHVGLILEAMRNHGGDSLLQEHGLGMFAAACLRRPDHSQTLFASDGVPTMLRGMRTHPESVNLQRQGCLALRNMAVRADDALKQGILDEGAEAVLRAAGRFQASVDEAYAALRDLGLQIGIVTVNAQVPNPNPNPNPGSNPNPNPKPKPK